MRVEVVVTRKGQTTIPIQLALCYLWTAGYCEVIALGIDVARYTTRFWYYFRMGYATYLNFLLGYVSTLVTVYYLALKSAPTLLAIFPKFVPFAVLATVIGVPFTGLVGWVHLKRSQAYRSEADINVESNPYNYKLPPGYWTDVFAPVYLELLTELKRLMEANKLLNSDDKARVDELEKKLRILKDGGYVGKPRIKIT
jgi:hypothetical protein